MDAWCIIAIGLAGFMICLGITLVVSAFKGKDPLGEGIHTITTWSYNPRNGLDGQPETAHPGEESENPSISTDKED